MLKVKFEITTDITVHEEESKKQIEVLKRFISVKDGVHTYKVDVRHSDIIVKEFGLQGAKTLSRPVSDANHEELLDHARFKKFQSLWFERTSRPWTDLTFNSEPLGAADRCQDQQCETGPN